MGTSSKILVLAAILGMASSQYAAQQPQPGYIAYSPGGGAGVGVPSYRAVPRLVGVQPGEALPLVKRIRVSPSHAGSYAAAATPTEYAARSPYAHHGGVQYSQTVPAVATYRSQPQQQLQHHVPTYTSPVQYRPAVYAPQQQVPRYYQHQPAPAPAVAPRQKVVQVAPRPLLKVQKPLAGKLGEVEPEEEYASDPNPQYNFAFDVKDDDLTNYQNRQETRDGGVVKGSYSVVDPDGYVRTVTYEASPKGGFQAKVTREPTDVKIKFPVPTPAPQEGQKPAGPQLYQYAPTAVNHVPRRYPHRLAVAPQQYAQQQYSQQQ